MKYTEASDDRADKKAGIKENSKRDMKLDVKRGLTPDITKKPKAAAHTSKVKPAQKASMGHPAGRKGDRRGPQMTKQSVTKVPRKATHRVTGNTRVFGD